MAGASFETYAHAKCILSGEHTVLRGGPALIVPILNKNIHMKYEDSNRKLIITPPSNPKDIFSLVFSKTLEHALHTTNLSLTDLHGEIDITNDIEIGAGLGFSAALCVVIARFLAYKNLIPPEQIFSFAHHLEHLFHGISSGADVAGAMAELPVYYELKKLPRTIIPNWHPYLYLSYSGISKITSAAIGEVNTLREQQQTLAKQIDEEMKQSVILMERALYSDKEEGLSMLISAIEQAKNCFEQWGLIPPDLKKSIAELYKLGALAVKPTGAGSGGYLLSLWRDTPPQSHSIQLERLIAT